MTSGSLFAEESKEKVSIDILSMGFGGSGYVASFALSELINKKSPILKATCIETGGSVENIKTLAAEPNRRKNTIIYSSYITPYLSSRGLHPFQNEYRGVKALSFTMNIMAFLSTLDSNIKSCRWLRGCVGRLWAGLRFRLHRAPTAEEGLMHIHFLDQYRVGDSLVHRLDPRAKLILAWPSSWP